MNRTEGLIQELKTKTEGLMFASEAEYPFNTVVWREQAQDTPLTSAEFLRIAGHSPETPLQAINVDTFFHRATQDQDWHGEIEKANVNKFRELAQLLKDSLEEVQVFKVGEFEMDAYILGKMDADFVGLSTKVVET
ncbi:MAG: nuclease [Acaryochloris sp. RU_4_1]|nr:nuclease [Acaryochloris sp. RU_4_1]NJR56463.1 nuclease [Acaryochloris sp. CRU_2_0]